MPNWQPEPVIRWLLAEGRFAGDIDGLACGLGGQLLAAGAPLWRLRLSFRTLHPLLTAFSAVWERETGQVTHIQAPHGMEQRPGYMGSPLQIMAQSGEPFRKKLLERLTEDDHNLLHELKARGATDYLGIPLRFIQGLAASLVFTTDDPAGFDQNDIAGFEAVAAVTAPIAEVLNTKAIAEAIAEAYLGSRTGKHVLEGRITRGHIETIDAAIMITDLRDWTGLNNRLKAEDATALANRYFDIIAQAISSESGEILKLLGDGILAVFPIEQSSPQGAARAALRAARKALAQRNRQSGLDFGIGMHLGPVLYGNVGSARRLDFTIMGQAVNRTARIEGLCRELGQPLLFSKEFALALGMDARRVASRELKGDDHISDIFTASD